MGFLKSQDSRSLGLNLPQNSTPEPSCDPAKIGQLRGGQVSGSLAAVFAHFMPRSLRFRYCHIWFQSPFRRYGAPYKIRLKVQNLTYPGTIVFASFGPRPSLLEIVRILVDITPFCQRRIFPRKFSANSPKTLSPALIPFVIAHFCEALPFCIFARGSSINTD